MRKGYFSVKHSLPMNHICQSKYGRIERVIFAVVALCIIGALSVCIQVQRQATQQTISDYVLRLHVRANSNSTADQQEKLKVRDAFLEALAQYQPEMTDKRAVQNIISKHGQAMLNSIMQNLKMVDTTQDLSIHLGTEWFPDKTYGDITLPAGMYDAVIVEVGSGCGQNWWCVIFPKLCFVSPVTGYIEEEDKAAFKEEVGENTWEMIESPEVEVKFKIAEVLGQWMGQK